MTTLPDNDVLGTTFMPRFDAAQKPRTFGWQERTIELLLYPTAPKLAFYAGSADERLLIRVVDSAVKPVRF